jgi:hypothetical protein
VQQTAVVVGVLAVFAALLSMADYRQVRARLRERLVPLGLLMVLAAVIWIERPKPPPVSVVDGVYLSSCCSPVELKDGIFVTSTLHVPFKLEMTKIGTYGERLVADPAAHLEVRAGKVERIASAAPSSMVFTKDQKEFTLCADPVCATEYQFVRR